MMQRHRRMRCETPLTALKSPPCDICLSPRSCAAACSLSRDDAGTRLVQRVVRDARAARVRLVTSRQRRTPTAGCNGTLDIDLKPGWKTYWRDPGDAGVPPLLDVSASTNIAAAEFDFPAPKRHDDGDFEMGRL